MRNGRYIWLIPHIYLLWVSLSLSLVLPDRNRGLMEFPEDFNQLELLNTHGHLIPHGASSLWTEDEVGGDEVEEEEGEHSEEWYLEWEEKLKDRPEELILWAAENNRVSTYFKQCFHGGSY